MIHIKYEHFWCFAIYLVTLHHDETFERRSSVLDEEVCCDVLLSGIPKPKRLENAKRPVRGESPDVRPVPLPSPACAYKWVHVHARKYLKIATLQHCNKHYLSAKGAMGLREDIYISIYRYLYKYLLLKIFLYKYLPPIFCLALKNVESKTTF